MTIIDTDDLCGGCPHGGTDRCGGCLRISLHDLIHGNDQVPDLYEGTDLQKKEKRIPELASIIHKAIQDSGLINEIPEIVELNQLISEME